MRNHSETVLVIIMSIILFSEGVWSVFDNPLHYKSMSKMPIFKKEGVAFH